MLEGTYFSYEDTFDIQINVIDCSAAAGSPIIKPATTGCPPDGILTFPNVSLSYYWDSFTFLDYPDCKVGIFKVIIKRSSDDIYWKAYDWDDVGGIWVLKTM